MKLNALLKQHPTLPRAVQLKQRMDAEAAAARAPKPAAPAQ